LQSGQPINRIPLGFGTTDLNGDGASFRMPIGNSDRFPGESRNNDRLPWSTTFDLEYNKLRSGNNKLELRADIFNIFNAENLSGYSNNATQKQPNSRFLAPVDCLHKEMHRHQDSFSVWSSLFNLIKLTSC
jgi:hypothetical protein